ncbi:MAG: sulfur carrier protein ThiS [Syntrophorhabdaceae bacterium]|nr:sulfur carrier protein ThiS [Syntrophorhabdaceae bacterium]
MEILYNGVWEEVLADTTVSDLVIKANEKDSGLIVEVNNRFIFPGDYGKTSLSEGDRVEFINPDFGG